MLSRISIGILFFAVAACTTATAPKSVSSATSGNKSEAGQARVCRDMSTTGTMGGPRHVCHTQAEWDRIDALS